MKRLVIILTVLVMGFWLGIWCFVPDLQGQGRIIFLSATSATAENSNRSAENSGTNSKLPADSNDVPSPAENQKTEKSAETEEKPKDQSTDDPLVAINLNNVEMKKILDKLASWTGKVIIPSDEAMKVKITIYAAQQVPQSQALSLIYDALRAKGIIAEISDNKLFLKPIAQAKLGHVPVITANEPLARIEDKSQLAEKYFKLKNTSPSKLAEVISPLTASYGHVTAYESSRSIAVIDTVENLIRIEKTITQFDMPDSDQIYEEIFIIEKGDPAEIVQILQLILQQSNGKRGSSRPAKPAAKGKDTMTPATSIVIDSGKVPIVLLPIPRHNWIIARASAEDMNKIKEWIKRLDIEESVPPEQTIIPVLYVDPYEVVRLVRNTIQEMPGSQLKASVVIEAMRNSKQVVVFGSEENRKIVEKLIAEIDLPVEDDFITEVFKLKHTDPDQIKENLEGLYEQEAGNFSSYSYRGGRSSSRHRNVSSKDVVKVISFPAMKQVTVIASEENIKKITAQIEEWDIPIDIKQDQYRIIPLKNSDPVQMVELLSTLFSEESEKGSSMNLMRMIFGGRGESETKKKIVGSLYGLLTFEAVPGTKKILVISKVPEAYDVIEKLVRDLDSQEEGEVPKVITLNYADAEELCDQLNAILNESGTTATLKRRQQGLSSTDFNTTQEDKSGQNNSRQQNNSPDIITPWWVGQRVDDSKMPTSNLIGKVRFVPVHRSKAILVLSPPEYLEEIEKMVAQLDKPGKQVMIEAVIVEVDHSSMTSLGVKLSNGKFTGDLGTNAVAALTEIAYGRVFSNGIKLDNSMTVSALVDLLAKTVNARILNQPNLWTKDNEEAVFFKGREISIKTSGLVQNTGAESSSFKQIPVGVTLQVRPSITPENDVDIKIYLEISDIASGGGSINDQPILNKLNTTTKLIIGDGETIMLGGILFQTESEVKNKVPLLGDIPVAGALFNHDEKNLRNNELLVFITPHVVDGEDRTAAQRYLKSPIEQLNDVRESLSGASDNDESKGSYNDSPIQRMEDIKRTLNEVLSEGILDTKE